MGAIFNSLSFIKSGQWRVLAGSETRDRQTEWNMKCKQMFERGKRAGQTSQAECHIFCVCGQVNMKKRSGSPRPGLSVGAAQPIYGAVYITKAAAS